jgi:NADPH-dependent 2,4-dienoyl-CoA reductase/sulfur reductase-like enzyme
VAGAGRVLAGEELIVVEQGYKYIIVGGGLAGASAVEGIREKDKDGRILLVAGEGALPYNRPPLTKGLWFGDEKVKDIFVHDDAFYRDNAVDLLRGSRVERIDRAAKSIQLSAGASHTYESSLLATGGSPRRLDVTGGNAEGVFYYRTLADYEALRAEATEGKTAVVIGGGFIGSEIAAALISAGVKVTMVFPDPYLVRRVFPEDLGLAIQKAYVEKGVNVVAGDSPSSIERQGQGFLTGTNGGKWLASDILVVGIGINPGTELAGTAGLDLENGITVNEWLQTSDANIYAAGDNANFPYAALRKRMRVEHWDNALNQGKQAGRNMAGAREPYTYMPFFFSDLFEFGYEAVGEVDSRLEVFEDWEEPFKTGVVYYLKDNRLRGAMMCNVWDKVDDARALIRADEPVTADSLRGRIKSDG